MNEYEIIGFIIINFLKGFLSGVALVGVGFLCWVGWNKLNGIDIE